MRAMVINSTDRPPEVTDFPDPSDDDDVADVVAAGFNPVDLVIASGAMHLRPLRPPAVAGIEGIAKRSDGSQVYFFTPPAPYGSFAERVPLAGVATTPVPQGVDVATAAALGVPGIAAWLALTRAGALKEGESVLVLGATGAVGQIALQGARVLGASTVAGTARSDEGRTLVEATGATAVPGSDAGALDAELGRVAPDGFDVVVDNLWGLPVTAALPHMRTGGRIVQVGNAAGMHADIAAPGFRNRHVSIIGHSNFLVTAQERLEAFTRVARLAAEDRIHLEVTTVALADMGATWRGRLDGAIAGKVVVVP